MAEQNKGLAMMAAVEFYAGEYVGWTGTVIKKIARPGHPWRYKILLDDSEDEYGGTIKGEVVGPIDHDDLNPPAPEAASAENGNAK